MGERHFAKFFPFSAELDRRRPWIATVNRKEWFPSEHSRLDFLDFVSGKSRMTRFQYTTSHLYFPTLSALLKVPGKELESVRK